MEYWKPENGSIIGVFVITGILEKTGILRIVLCGMIRGWVQINEE
jgi:hypothetical protein